MGDIFSKNDRAKVGSTYIGENMMKEELIDYLNNRNSEYLWEEGEYKGEDGIFVKHLRFNTITHISDRHINRYDLNSVKAHLHQGKNVEHVTRVTGFFSKTSSWNPGKRGELVDRKRTEI